uniref:Fibroblast growth factor binding protein 3 n=1 Tax=Podarcis muralis TaxID=64176 RepID=A0A670HSD8_PODMU
MRLPQTLPLTLLFLSCLEGTTGRKSKESSEKVKPASSPWAQSGQFSTRDKHLCSWQVISGEEATELLLSCHQPGEQGGKRQQCIYRGQPELCAAYSSKGRQFWKQILGKLRRKQHPCQDSSPLKSRLCSSKKGTSEAQLYLVPTAPAPQKPPQAPRNRAISSPAKAEAPTKRNKEGKRKGGPGSSAAPTQPSSMQPTSVAGGTGHPTELNAGVVEAYCEEKWHSLCNFFVNFWNG